MPTRCIMVLAARATSRAGVLRCRRGKFWTPSFGASGRATLGRSFCDATGGRNEDPPGQAEEQRRIEEHMKRLQESSSERDGPEGPGAASGGAEDGGGEGAAAEDGGGDQDSVKKVYEDYLEAYQFQKDRGWKD